MANSSETRLQKVRDTIDALMDDFIIVEGRWHHEEWVDKNTQENRQRDVIMATYIHREPRSFHDVTPSAATAEEDVPF